MRNLHKLIILFMLMAMVSGCANIIKPETSKETYLVALTEYNNLLELYVKNSAQIKDIKLKADANVLFLAGSDALDAWSLVISMGEDDYEQKLTTNQIMSKLIDIVFRVLEVTKI